MKWFQHECDAHSHPKWKQLVKEFGPDGYYVGFATLEIIGKFGDKYLRLSLEKYPITDFSEALRVKEDTIKKVWDSMAKKSLLSRNHLKDNVLYSQKLKERADEYTKKLQSKSGQYRDNIRLQYNTLQDITKHYIKLKGYSLENFTKDDWGRCGRAIKTLYYKAKKNEELIKACITWVSERGYCDWTLETCIKKWPDFLKYIEVVQAKDKQGREAQEKFRKMKEEAIKEGLIPKEKLDELIKQVTDK